VGAETQDGRDETDAERADRRYGEQLQELRVAQTGVQLLLGFQLTIAFTPPFAGMAQEQKDLYVATIACAALAFLSLMAPVMVHRALFGRGLKRRLVSATHWLTLVGMTALALAVTGSVTLAAWMAEGPDVARWFAIGTGLATVLLWVLLPGLLRARPDPTDGDHGPVAVG
jgi:hypothetical protein